ncbi:hypothetical protein Bca101_046060 [Brassica carinata]
MEDRHVSPAVLYIQVSVFQEQYKIVTLADYRLLEARAGNARSFVDDPAETDDMSGRLSPFAAELSLANRIKLYYYADPYEIYLSELASFYTCKPRNVSVPDDLRRVLWEGKVRDLAKFAEMTGLDGRHVGPREGQKLVSLFQCSSVVQCKLTRAEIPTIDYNVKDLLKTLHFTYTAYVHTMRELDSAYNLILYGMCQQYPSPLFGGVEHVKIPADGDAIYLVGYSPMKCYRNVVVTLELVMDTMIEYSDQFGLGEELESAMIIACSLRQNRYLEKVGLPAVLSNCDLIYPALTEPETGGGVREKPTLSKKAAVMLGRFHQMSCLVLFKDFDTSFRNDTDRDWTMSSLFSMHEGRILTEYEMSGGILPASSDLIWLRFLNNEESMARLRKHSVFEGFWLVKERSRLSIRIRLPGFYFDDNFDVLMEEVVLGGSDPERKCSDGAFNVGLSCIRRVDRSGRRRILSSSHEGTSSSNVA